MKLKSEIHLETLFRQSLAGDQTSYRQFLNEVSAWLRKVMAGRIFNQSDVEDVVQEILVSIHKARHTYDGSRRLMPWLNAIATYRLKDHLRRHYARKQH